MRLFILIAALAVVVLALTLSAVEAPDAANWGVHHYGYLGTGWLLAGLLAAGAVLVLGGTRIGERLVPRGWTAAGLVAAVTAAGGILFWFARERAYLLSEGSLLIRGVREGRLAWESEPLALWIETAAHRVLGSPDPSVSFAVVSVAAGVGFLLLAAGFARLAADDAPGRVAAFAILVTAGIVRLFFGYVATGPILALVVLAYLVLGLTALRSGRWLLLAGVLVAIAVPLRVTAVLLVPSLIYLAAVAPGSAARRTLLVAVPLVLLGVGTFLAWREPGRFDAMLQTELRRLLPLDPAGNNRLAYGILDRGHLADFFQEQLLLGPFAALFVIPLWILGWLRPLGREGRFLLLAGVPWWIVSFLMNREIGAARAWDAYAAASLPFLLLAAWVLVRNPWRTASPALARWGIAAVVAVSVFHAVPWIAADADEERAVHRFVALFAPGTPAAPFARSCAFEELSTYYLDREDYDSAEVALTEAYAADPGNTRLAGNLGAIRLIQGRLPAALEVLEDAVERTPSNEVLQYQLGGAYREGGMINEAARAYRTALELNPEFRQAYLNLAVMERQAGRPAEAEAVLLEARRRYPEEGEVWSNLGRVYEDLGRVDEAVGAYRRGLELRPEDTAAAFNLGLIHLARNSHRDAIAVFADIVERTPNDVEAWINLGISRVKVGDHDGGRAALARAREIAPARPEPYMNLAQSYLLQGRTADATTVLEDYAARDSTSGYGQAVRVLLRRLRAEEDPRSVIVVWILLLVLLHVAVLAGLAAIVLGLGGNFILLALALITAWAGGFEHMGWWLLIVLAALAVLGEVVESFLGVAAARGFGATKWGMLGTFIGGILGAALGTVVFPVVGSIIGAFVGAFAGAFGAEWLAGRETGVSAKAGLGAFLGRVAATGFKFGVGGVIAFYTLRAAYRMF